MISVDKAKEIIVNNVRLLGIENVDISKSYSRIIAEDIFSKINLPEFDSSSMDGFALNAEDLTNLSERSPAKLKIVAEIKAGELSAVGIKQGEASRIMTGGYVPEGADAVVKVEDAIVAEDGFLEIAKTLVRGENVRKRAENIKEGDLIISKGEKLEPQHVGMLSSLGYNNVKVAKRPKVAVLTTGNELVASAEKHTPGKILSSNNYSLCGQIEKNGCVAVDMGIVKDNKKDITEKLKEALEYDIIITSGGVSMGEYDFVKECLESLDAEIHFWKVAIKPGKPILFSTVNGKPVFSLPGNPVSVMVGFETFVKPALYKMQEHDFKDNIVDAVIDEDIDIEDERRHYVRAITQWSNGEYHARSTGMQSSGNLTSMIKANSFVIASEEARKLNKGHKVKVVLFD